PTLLAGGGRRRVFEPANRVSDSPRDEIVPGGVRVPAIALQVDLTERIERQHGDFVRRGDRHVANRREVEAFPLSRRAAVRVDIAHVRTGGKRRLHAPHAVASLLVSIDPIVVHPDRVRHVVSELRVWTDDRERARNGRRAAENTEDHVSEGGWGW